MFNPGLSVARSHPYTGQVALKNGIIGAPLTADERTLSQNTIPVVEAGHFRPRARLHRVLPNRGSPLPATAPVTTGINSSAPDNGPSRTTS